MEANTGKAGVAWRPTVAPGEYVADATATELQRMVVFNTLKPLHDALGAELTAAAARVVEGAWYILGAEGEAFEREFADYCGTAYAVGVANGTDAVELALRAAGVGSGDEVITVALTAVATVCAVERTGATPVLVDVDPATATMDPAAAEAAVTPRTRALLPVHLYGHPADMDRLTALAERYGLHLVEDCAQAHGARWRGRRVGSIGACGAFSFYPTKNLGALGDGGAVVTNDPATADRLRRLRNYGQKNRYQHVERGVNSRLDEMQAAMLRVKLPRLDEHNDARRRIAALYADRLPDVAGDLILPRAVGPIEHAYHLYVARSRRRDELRNRLTQAGVETQIHYPTPVHRQPAYLDLGMAAGSLPVTERLAAEILSLPMYVGLTDGDVDAVAASFDECLRRAA
ncbi:MAG: DegT/DnrJ/EryC1/StrS family aminotransferase [Planctomycetia bacterium]